jgi:hypothetical protein
VQDTTAFSVNPWQVPQFTSRGYRLVTVNQCVTDGEDWPYTFVGPYGTRDSSWVC